MRKLINSAFLLLLTLFIVGKSWADCPNFNINQLTQDDFKLTDRETDPSWLVFKGLVNEQSLQYLSQIKVQIICDQKMRYAGALFNYQCFRGTNNFSVSLYPARALPFWAGGYKGYHVLSLNTPTRPVTKFSYGNLALPTTTNRCGNYIIDAEDKILYNLEML